MKYTLTGNQCAGLEERKPILQPFFLYPEFLTNDTYRVDGVIIKYPPVTHSQTCGYYGARGEQYKGFVLEGMESYNATNDTVTGFKNLMHKRKDNPFYIVNRKVTGNTWPRPFKQDSKNRAKKRDILLMKGKVDFAGLNLKVSPYWKT